MRERRGERVKGRKYHENEKLRNWEIEKVQKFENEKKRRVMSADKSTNI